MPKIAAVQTLLNHLFSVSYRAMPLALLALGVLFAQPTQAGNWTTQSVYGALLTVGGGPIADGDYALTFNIFNNDKAVAPAVWSEGPVVLTVTNGRFAYALGYKAPIAPSLLAPGGVGQDLWLSIQVGNDPPLPVVALRSVLYAQVAQQANSLACSACLTAAQLDPGVLKDYAKAADLVPLAKAADLQAYAKAVDLLPFAKTVELQPYAKSASLSNVATTGKYSDLESLPVMAKIGAACGSGLVVQGIDKDGALQCVAQPLPPDGLSVVSNGLLSDVFSDTFAGAGNVAIKDFYPLGVSDQILVPDVGTAENLTIAVDISNSALLKLKVSVFDPKNVEYVLWNGSADGKLLKTSFPDKSKPVNGDLGSWGGKNPVGKWTIVAIDSSFDNVPTDGLINAWSISTLTLSTKKVVSNGVFVAQGGLIFQLAVKHPVVCNAAQTGYAYVNTNDQALYICNGKDFFPLNLGVVGSQATPGASCKDILTKAPLSKDGYFWIDVDGPGGGNSFQVWCDMSTDGGGWTRGMVMIAGDKTTCDTLNRWQTIETITKNWAGGGLVLSKYFNVAKASPEGAVPNSVVKFSPGPYGTIYKMFAFPDEAASWAYDSSPVFNLTNVGGWAYGNGIWWNYGKGVTQKANYCIGTAPNHATCLYEGNAHGQCGCLYNNTTNWVCSGVAQELYVREQ